MLMADAHLCSENHFLQEDWHASPHNASMEYLKKSLKGVSKTMCRAQDLRAFFEGQGQKSKVIINKGVYCMCSL